MDTKLIFGAIILLVLVSIQYTLNLILRELKSLRISKTSERSIDIDNYNGRKK